MSPVPKASPGLIGEDVKTLAADSAISGHAEIHDPVDAAAITYLLDLHRRIGPICAYFDELYKV
ncbi:hypothetical protein [Rhizobium sp. CNPSo 3490]|uniref:hypothetical protein n=1 Tax=Rhizobium sp. CNPSo 3490 TaxID=3021407 RepID=UPI00254FF23C|nr:hypothetical protein [Rhizobium sp. CNPSo 3490]MDK4732171.1 hypothetical protein [Rhizobium sp. CNPSo 3490]